MVTKCPLPPTLRLFQCHLLFVLREHHAIDGVGHIKRIEPGFGVHLQNPNIFVQEQGACHLALLDQARFLQQPVLHRIVLFTEVIAAYRITHVHVHHTPRRQHRLLCGVFEIGENLGDFHHTARGHQLVCGFCHAADAHPRSLNYILIVKYQQFQEQLFVQFLRHKLLPGGRVHLVHKFRQPDGFIKVSGGSENQQR